LHFTAVFADDPGLPLWVHRALEADQGSSCLIWARSCAARMMSR